jgi:hypothetical protein
MVDTLNPQPARLRRLSSKFSGGKVALRVWPCPLHPSLLFTRSCELGFNTTEFGKAILAACFINDLGTVIQ